MSASESVSAQHFAAGRIQEDVLQRALRERVIPHLLRVCSGHAANSDGLREFAQGGALAHTHPVSLNEATYLARQAVLPLAHLLLEPDPLPATALVTQMYQRGMPLETLYMELIGPAARQLGEWWTDDLCGFTEVTIGTGRLQQMLRELGLACSSEQASAADVYRLLLLPTPGEQHSLGLSMVSDFFLRAGWDVVCGRRDLIKTPAQQVGSDWFDAIGLSIVATVHIDTLTRTVAAVRRTSRNPHMAVVVGGPVVAEQPELLVGVGADLLLSDARQAPAQVAAFLTSKRQVN